VITFRQTKADRASARRHLPEHNRDQNVLLDGKSLANIMAARIFLMTSYSNGTVTVSESNYATLGAGRALDTDRRIGVAYSRVNRVPNRTQISRFWIVMVALSVRRQW
jgi:hypothetical protein